MSPRLAAIILFIALATALVSDVAAAPTYSIAVNPPSPIGCGGTVTLTLALTGAQNNRAYTVVLEVRKPNGTGTALTSRIINTNNAGAGSTSTPYPDLSFTALNGTVATDVPGVYTVIANQTGPTNTGIEATAQFTVSCQLTVVVTEPVSGSFVERGRRITISATVSDPSGPTSIATVRADSPTGGEIVLSPLASPGAYSTDYQVLLYDPLGPWTINVRASDPRGNSGSGTNPPTVTIIRNELVVDALAAYNSKGVPAVDFAPGETIYPFFRVRYSSGDPLTTGQYRVAIKNPSGTIMANLTAAYDTSRFGFYSPTGFTISSIDLGGAWSLALEAGSLNDGFGNTGPGIETSIRIQVIISPLGYIPFLLGGLIALLGGIVVTRRYRTSLAGFEHLEQLMGGEMPRGSSLLLLGDPGSGKTVISYQLLWEELEAGKHCALLSYDAFPEDIQGRMREFGWDIIPYLRKGRLKIIDCYSGLTGEGQGAIRDPSDLTELNIQVTSFITKAKGGTVTLILDSLTPIFNGVDAKQAINFIQTVGAKVKRPGGLFILTASNGAVPDDSVAKIKSIVDGIIELTLVRTGRHVSRYLSVMKMERRKISQDSVPIEIDRKRGLVFRVSRLKIAKDQLTKALPFYNPETEAQPKNTREEGPTPRRQTSTVPEKSGKSITPEPDKTRHASSDIRRPWPQRRERDDS